MTGFGTSIDDLLGRIAPSAREIGQPAGARAGALEGARQPRETSAPAARVVEAGDIVSASELVAGIHHSDVRRLIVLSTDADRGLAGGVELVRRLTASGLTAVLVDLSRGDRVSAAMGLRPDSAGFAALAQGLSALNEVIHRDHFTRAHVVPSAGYELASADGANLADLRLFLAAFARAYECVVIEWEPTAIARLPVILDEQTALVAAGPPGTRQRSQELVEALRTLGIDDLLFMESNHLVARPGSGRVSPTGAGPSPSI